jgi:hypothetical protein
MNILKGIQRLWSVLNNGSLRRREFNLLGGVLYEKFRNKNNRNQKTYIEAI